MAASRRAWLGPNLAVGAASAALGVVAVVVPAHLSGTVRSIGSPVFDWLFSAWHACNCLVTITLLFGIGFALAFRWPEQWVGAGLGAMLMFPVSAVIEMLANANSHTLFPIEFVIYGAFTMFSLAGAGLGRWIRKRKNALAV